METKTTRQVIEAFNDAWINRDAEKLAELLSDYVVWTLPEAFDASGREPVESRDEAITKLIVGPGSVTASILKAETIRRSVRQLVVEGDTAVGFHHMTADLVRGGTYNANYVWRYTCADGRVTRLDEFLDTLHVYKQLPDHPLFRGLLDA